VYCFVEAIKTLRFCPSDENVPPIEIVVYISIAKDGGTKRDVSKDMVDDLKMISS
jgi:hypothetical protein